MKKLIVFLAAISMVAVCAMSAAAAEWNFYGSARMTTFSVDDDNPGAIPDDRDTTWALQGNSRIGAKVKVNDTLSGRFEYGTGINLRLLYGEWDFGSGKLLVGQDYTPTTYWYSNQVFDSDNDLLDCGNPYAGRQPQIKLTFGDLKVAFISPNAKNNVGIAGDVDTTLPKIEASYNFKADGFFIDAFGGYNTYEVGNVDIDSYLVGIGGGADFGAAFLKAQIFYAENGDEYGLMQRGDSSLAYAPATGLIDCETVGGLALLGFKASDTLTLEGGVGYVSHELDTPGANEDETITYYVNCTVNFAPGVFIVPEVGMIDLKDNAANADEGEITYFGLKWQINF
jgi:hypothetical protein